MLCKAIIDFGEVLDRFCKAITYRSFIQSSKQAAWQQRVAAARRRRRTLPRKDNTFKMSPSSMRNLVYLVGSEI